MIQPKMKLLLLLLLLPAVGAAQSIWKPIVATETWHLLYDPSSKYAIGSYQFNPNTSGTSSNGNYCQTYSCLPPLNAPIFNFKIGFLEIIKEKLDSVNTVKQQLQAQKELIAKGCFEGDCQNGYGRLSHATIEGYRWAVDYKGNFKQGSFEGEGTLRTFNVTYKGNFSQGKFDGFGIAEYSGFGLKNRYVGQWKNNQKHGEGTLVHEDGTVFSGTWENNKLKHGMARLKDTSVFAGEFLNGRPDNYFIGFGTLTRPDGSKVKGLFKMGKLFKEAQAKSQLSKEDLEAVKPVFQIITTETIDTTRRIAELESALKAGADPDEADQFGYTPLYLAASGCQPESIKLLLLYKADVHKESKDYGSPLNALISSPYPRSHASAIEYFECIELLIKAGADPAFKNRYSGSGLIFGWYFTCALDEFAITTTEAKEFLEKLIGLGVPVNITDQYGNNVLKYAKEHKNRQLYKLLKPYFN